MKKMYGSIRRMKKRAGGVFCRYINGTQGVISLFLAILMVPFVSVAGALINAARINSTIAVFDEALCNASNSTLGTYDAFLKKRFGLLAMAQDGVGGNYSGKDLILETFQFYMEQNLGVLSNTYLKAESEAAGVYPLADPDVLLAEVMEYSKYTVPTKIAADVLPLDTLLKDLTKNFTVAGDILNVISSSMNTATSFDTCQTDIKSLVDRLDECAPLEEGYTTNYTGFSGAAAQYNAALSTMKTQVDAAWVKVNEAEKKVQAAQDALDAAGEDDDTASLREALTVAQAELTAAKEELEMTVNTNRTELVGINTDAETWKGNYINALTALRSKVEEVKAATLKAQESVNNMVSDGADLLGNVLTTVNDSKKKSYKKNTETLSELQKAAEESGNTQAAYLWEQEVTKNKENEVAWDNDETVAEAGGEALSGAAGDIAEFGTKNLGEQYDKLLAQIDACLEKARNYPIPVDGKNPQGLTADNYTTFRAMAATDSCYQNLEIPLKSQDVIDLMENLGNDLVASSFMAVVKALIEFIRAMLAVDLWVNPKLNSSLTTGSFSSVGGLPSKKNRSTYPLTSPYEEIDKQQSDYYKSLMGAYSTNALNPGSVNSFITTVNAIMDDIDAISTAWGEIKWYNVLSKLGEILKRVISIGKNLLSLMGQIVQVIATAVYEKVLLAGYLGYNTANRTTYSGKALTGASYGLPSEGANGKCLYGAETEYIIMGDESEAANQTYLFFIIYIIRVLTNIPVVLMNGEVQTIATAAGAASFGVATPIVYVMYILAEPLVDTMILVNEGDIPVVKTIAYLTPSGVGELVKAFTSLKMTAAQTTKARACLSNVMSGQNVDADFGQTYAEEMDVFGDASDTTTGKINGLFEMNYTHMLILIMLFIPSQEMVKRLGDIIQMEAANDSGGDFNLDKSYTYLRASGSFTTSEFIRLSDSGELNSTKRVVYRGY